MSTSQGAIATRRFMASVDLQTGGSRVVLEREDDLGVGAEQFFDHLRRVARRAQRGQNADLAHARLVILHRDGLRSLDFVARPPHNEASK